MGSKILPIETACDRYSTGHQLLQARKVDEALQCFDEAQQLGYDASECAAGRWDCWMLSGRFERAWAESDCIAQCGAEDPHRFWNGEPWHGRRVMLRCLHGLGDTIQFIRYAERLRSTASSLAVQVHPELVTLLEGVPGVDFVCTWDGSSEPAWDVQMEVNELPRIFRSTAASFPCKVPYISVPDERAYWSRHILPPQRSSRIGLVWQSGAWNLERSIPMELLGPLFASGEYEFFSLQKGAAPGALESPWPLLDLEPFETDVRNTAALMLHLDLIVTVDSMTAHLAGALGKPVWILLPFEADWRWMLERADTPWYPTARLFRQTQPGDWPSVIDSVAAQLSLGIFS
jgi:hypothetical protein